MLGRTVGSYRVTRKLAEGGMGAVYVGEHAVMQREAVIKVLLPGLSENKEMVNRFFNEARAAASIHHPGIVEVFDVGFLEGQAFIVMEKLRGESLATRLTRTRKLPLDQAVTTIRQLAGALAAAHARGIVHRDLKPDNIFLVPDPEVPGGERVKVLDFGIAKLLTGAGSVATKAGSIFGTPAYMAPEQCRDAGEVDHRADVYAIGCIFYELLTGRPPFGAGGIELLAAHLRDVPAVVTTLDPTIPPSVAGLVATLLAKDPGQRYPSCEAFIAALDHAAPSASKQLRALASHELPTVMASGSMPAMGSGVGPLPTPGPPLGSAPPPGTKVLTTHSSAAAQMTSDPGLTQPTRGGGGRGTAIIVAASVAVVGGVVLAVVMMRGGSKDKTQGGGPPAGEVDAALAVKPTAPPVVEIDAAVASSNRWVKVAPASGRVLLGLAADTPDASGFRPDQVITAPTLGFEIQEHEVTFAEFEPWYNQHPEAQVRALVRNGRNRAKLPITGASWTAAYEYCRSIGGALPSEEQWELAARGAELRPASWGDARLDPVLTHAFAGDDAWPVAVMTSDQDRTPGPIPIWDLMGNAREWTADVWRSDRASEDDAWAVEGGMTYRAIRGLPLRATPPATLQRELAAYRDSLCATGSCLDKSWDLLASVGFRCARAAP